MLLDITKPIVTKDGRPAKYLWTAPDGRLMFAHRQTVRGADYGWCSSSQSPDTVDGAFKNPEPPTARYVLEQIRKWAYDREVSPSFTNLFIRLNAEVAESEPEIWSPSEIPGIAGRPETWDSLTSDF